MTPRQLRSRFAAAAYGSAVTLSAVGVALFYAGHEQSAREVLALAAGILALGLAFDVRSDEP